MSKPTEINMSHHFDPLSILGTLLFYILGVFHNFQDVIVIAVGASTLMYNVFKFLKENFPNAYKKLIYFISGKQS